MTEDLLNDVQYLLDLAGIFAFALTGALLAVRKDFDILGTLLLAETTGLGGGLVRDLIIGVTPVAFTDPWYYLAPAPAALVVFCWARSHRHPTAVALLDASALALFSVTGTVKALEHGFTGPAAIVLGAITAAGGGVLSSLLAHEVPAALRWDSDLYVVPCLVGASAAALLDTGGILNPVSGGIAALSAFILRIFALRQDWRTPRSSIHRRAPDIRSLTVPRPLPHRGC